MIKYFLPLLILISSQSSFADTKETYRQLSIFNEVYNRVKNQYVEELTDKELVEKALNGMLQALDPHSSYMNEEVYKEMQVDTAGAFGGLGIEITTDKSFIKIVSPIDDTPAQKAGVQAGDYITHLDGVSVIDMTLKEAIDIMRGEVGASITLTIVRGTENPFDIEIERDIIKVQSVKHRLIDDIGVLRISTFNEQTTPGLKKIIEELESSDNPPIGYVLDLRNNPGGLLTESISVSDVFLEQGEIVSIRGREKKDVKVYSAKKGDLINKKPLIVLINEGSASASEIVAGALQDHDRAVIMGIKSFGKGSVQTIVPIDSGAIRLTIAKYYTPSGDSIQAVGIEPDIIVPRAELNIIDDYFTFRESDYKDALENETNEGVEEEEDYTELLENDYQLSRAIDAVKTIAVLN
ncbi:MAG: S41 family peptidase [Alphaproteobacteria bacterium]|jgi:carboxyl-terminal processing protease|nr:S41 family peptidase [Alphaproteobacteria bacterium]MDC0594252.1 S41 family peptidase [Alphaproteobacteria bacterium]MDC0967877.1 S41 family peptidase [Alphaproteobacteria bacterium]MDG2166163.1 S41 family peptidase [Alphaproteobacteria bacterium]|tara:strand:- start:388 stop:1614 length:1227 start_codon:yes stop_codon:yes gene_type:complete